MDQQTDLGRAGRPDFFTPEMHAIADADAAEFLMRCRGVEPFAKRRERAIEAAVEAVQDFAAELDFDDVEDFLDDCRKAIGEIPFTARQQKQSEDVYEDSHPRRPTR